eukprot:SAG31_NODE_849_length_11529_cov_3.342257_6_plen_176_part_00
MLPFLDEIDPFAESIGSVNTVIRRGQKLIGFNTDADGFRSAIQNGGVARTVGAHQARAVVYGYGGVTNCVVHVLKQLGFKVSLTGRRLDEASRRATVLGADLFAPGDEASFDLLVNAAPVTDQPLEQAVGLLEALGKVARGGYVFDHESTSPNLLPNFVLILSYLILSYRKSTID